jgi:small neutral amino acid transporter SnatA (MarC family)
MLATIVNQSINAAQVFALLAFFGAAIYVVWCIAVKDFPALVLGIAVALIAVSMLFGWGPTPAG